MESAQVEYKLGTADILAWNEFYFMRSPFLQRKRRVHWFFLPTVMAAA